MSEQAYEIVYDAPSEIDANDFKDMLESAGIPVVVLPAEELFVRLYRGSGLWTPMRIGVPPSQAPYARMLVADYQAQIEVGAYALQGEDE